MPCCEPQEMTCCATDVETPADTCPMTMSSCDEGIFIPVMAAPVNHTNANADELVADLLTSDLDAMDLQHPVLPVSEAGLTIHAPPTTHTTPLLL